MAEEIDIIAVVWLLGRDPVKFRGTTYGNVKSS